MTVICADEGMALEEQQQQEKDGCNEGSGCNVGNGCSGAAEEPLGQATGVDASTPLMPPPRCSHLSQGCCAVPLDLHEVDQVAAEAHRRTKK